MTSCYPPPRMRWNAAIGAIARGKRVSTGCGRKRRSVRVWRSICGVKRKPKAVNKPLHYFIVHELDKPGSSTTVSGKLCSHADSPLHDRRPEETGYAPVTSGRGFRLEKDHAPARGEARSLPALS